MKLCKILIVCCFLLSGLSYTLVAFSDEALDSPGTENSGQKVTVPGLKAGWGKLSFELPEPGTYDLPSIRPALDGKVLLDDGSEASLLDLMHGKFTFLTFMYTQCSDINGCPLSAHVLNSISHDLKHAAEFKDVEVRMISLSFDPKKDTPEVMKRYAIGFIGAKPETERKSDWIFLTTDSLENLRPILRDYGQFVLQDKVNEGGAGFAHILRAYLIDKQGKIRQIYSVDFIHKDILLTDLTTLILEEKSGEQS